MMNERLKRIRDAMLGAVAALALVSCITTATAQRVKGDRPFTVSSRLSAVQSALELAVAENFGNFGPTGQPVQDALDLAGDELLAARQLLGSN